MTPQQKNAYAKVCKTLDYLQKAMLALPNKELALRKEIELVWDKLYNKYK